MTEDAGVMDVGLGVGLGEQEAAPTVDGISSAEDHPGTDSIESVDKDSKAYRDAIKAWRDSAKDNPEIFKHAKRAYDLNGRMEQLRQLDPKGVDGVRSTYALIQSAGGVEAITDLQEKAAQSEAQNELWSKGDPKAFENIPPEWDKGLAKIAPQYLDRIMKADPESYAAAILPHLMTQLNQSAVPVAVNAMIDILQSAQGTPEEKINAIKAHLAKIGGWWNTQEQRAGHLKNGRQADPAASEFETRRTQFEKEKSEHLWNTQIWPDVLKYQTSAIEAALRPHQDRLKFEPAAYKALLNDLNAAVNKDGGSDKDFTKTMDLYRKAKSPNPAQVQAHVKRFVDKYAKPVVDRVVNERYGKFLNSRPGPKPGQSSVTPRPSGPGAPTMVSAKPGRDTIDFNKTTRDMLWKGTYVLKSGKTVQVQKA